MTDFFSWYCSSCAVPAQDLNALTGIDMGGMVNAAADVGVIIVMLAVVVFGFRYCGILIRGSV